VGFRPVDAGNRLGPAFGDDQVGFVSSEAEHVTDARLTEVNPVYSVCKLARQTDTLSVADYRMALKVSHLAGDTQSPP
jgi:hypothetical protein